MFSIDLSIIHSKYGNIPHPTIIMNNDMNKAKLYSCAPPGSPGIEYWADVEIGYFEDDDTFIRVSNDINEGGIDPRAAYWVRLEKAYYRKRNAAKLSVEQVKDRKISERILDLLSDNRDKSYTWGDLIGILDEPPGLVRISTAILLNRSAIHLNENEFLFSYKGEVD